MSRSNPPSDSGSVIDLSARFRRNEAAGESSAARQTAPEAQNEKPATVATLPGGGVGGSNADGADSAVVFSPEEDGRTKREHLADLLDHGKVQVRLDPRRPGVAVPERFADDPVLALNLSWRFPQTNMVLNDRGVAATLRFGGVPFRCQIPWSAIWAVATPDSELLKIWLLDLPPEFGGPSERDDSEQVLPVEPGRPKLSVLGGESSKVETATIETGTIETESGPDATATEATEGEGTREPPRKPGLRIVR